MDKCREEFERVFLEVDKQGAPEVNDKGEYVAQFIISKWLLWKDAWDARKEFDAKLLEGSVWANATEENKKIVTGYAYMVRHDGHPTLDLE